MQRKEKILPPDWDLVSHKSDGTITSTSSIIQAHYTLQQLTERKVITETKHFLVDIKVIVNMSSFRLENMFIMLYRQLQKKKAKKSYLQLSIMQILQHNYLHILIIIIMVLLL